MPAHPPPLAPCTRRHSPWSSPQHTMEPPLSLGISPSTWWSSSAPCTCQHATVLLHLFSSHTPSNDLYAHQQPTTASSIVGHFFCMQQVLHTLATCCCAIFSVQSCSSSLWFSNEILLPHDLSSISILHACSQWWLQLPLVSSLLIGGSTSCTCTHEGWSFLHRRRGRQLPHGSTASIPSSDEQGIEPM